jgi:hypothetical protein
VHESRVEDASEGTCADHCGCAVQLPVELRAQPRRSGHSRGQVKAHSCLNGSELIILRVVIHSVPTVHLSHAPCHSQPELSWACELLKASHLSSCLGGLGHRSLPRRVGSQYGFK